MISDSEFWITTAAGRRTLLNSVLGSSWRTSLSRRRRQQSSSKGISNRVQDGHLSNATSFNKRSRHSTPNLDKQKTFPHEFLNLNPTSAASHLQRISMKT